MGGVTEWGTHKNQTITATSILHLIFALNLMTPQSPALETGESFQHSSTQSLTFQLPAALNTPPGVSLFTFHYLYSVYIHLPPQPGSELVLPLWLPGANISEGRASTPLTLPVCLNFYTYLCTCVFKYTVGGLSQLCQLGRQRRRRIFTLGISACIASWHHQCRAQSLWWTAASVLSLQGDGGSRCYSPV